MLEDEVFLYTGCGTTNLPEQMSLCKSCLPLKIEDRTENILLPKKKTTKRELRKTEQESSHTNS